MTTLPKIYFLFWDMSKISLLQTLTLTTFHRLNPDWQVIVYLYRQNHTQLGKNVYVPDYTGKDYWYLIEEMDFVEFIEIDLEEYKLDLTTHGILISDRLRIQKLYEHGGVYSDFDVLWLKPISYLASVEAIGDTLDYEATVCMYKTDKGFHSISNFLAEPNSPFMGSILSEQYAQKPPFGHQSFGADIFNRLYPTLDSIRRKYPRVIGLPYETFFPYDVNNLNPLYRQDDLTRVESKNVLCLHWFNGHKLSKEYINKEEYKPCSMTSLLKREGLI